MTASANRLTVAGMTVLFDPQGGRIDDMILDTGDPDNPLRPLHRAPWVDGAEDLPDSIAPVERKLAGDFFCAPFGSQPGQPIHGWTANGNWIHEATDQHADGAITATYRLARTVQGAVVRKLLTLRPNHPFLYQCHRFEGGAGHLPVAHHAMIRVPGGARLSFSPKRFGVTPDDPPESDSARGRSRLAYPKRFDALSQVATADGAAVDATRYPFADRHEDTLVLAESAQGIGWSAALAAADGFLFFAIKDARHLPETILWMSHGGRDYAPWLGRHTYVLGIEEAATSCHADGRFTSAPDTDDRGMALGLTLNAGQTVEVRYGFGAIPVPAGWTKVSDIRIEGQSATLFDVSGESRTIPLQGTYFAD